MRESQITYAALDAYCLLEIYNTLAAQCDRLGIPFQDICHHVHHPTQKPNQDGQKTSKNKSKKSQIQVLCK